jgi:hypothetical protein
MAISLGIAGCAGPQPSLPRPTAAVTAPDVLPSSLDVAGSWRAATVEAPDSATFKRAADANGRIAGDRTVWAVAADGSWIPAEAIDANARWGVIGWRGGFVDWGQVGTVRTSADGLNWHDARTGPGEANLSMIVPAGDRLLLIGQGVQTTAGAWLSDDGSTWTEVRGAPAELWAAASWPGRGIVAAGGSGPGASMWTSADGSSWRAAAKPMPEAGDLFVSGVATGPAGVVAIGAVDERPAAWRSTDLVTWTEAGVAWGRDAFLQSVVNLDGTFVIAGRRSNHPTLWLSRDGVGWLAIDLPIAAGTDGEAARAAVVNGTVVAFGYTTHDEGNGGSSRVADLVWTLARP